MDKRGAREARQALLGALELIQFNHLDLVLEVGIWLKSQTTTNSQSMRLTSTSCSESDLKASSNKSGNTRRTFLISQLKQTKAYES